VGHGSIFSAHVAQFSICVLKLDPRTQVPVRPLLGFSGFRHVQIDPHSPDAVSSESNKPGLIRYRYHCQSPVRDVAAIAVAQPPFKNAPARIGHGLITQTATTMKKLFTRRREPKLARAVQLPESGFDHPFRDAGYYHLEWQGREHPRTVSMDSSRTDANF